MSIAWTRLPFRLHDPAGYAGGLAEWIGEAFYERLPAAGYQVREEQIYFAFRVADALGSGRALLAEAGSGTGKTFGYLLPAICHARLRGQPVVIATATAALQEQLAGPGGDVAAISALLDLGVDVRVARRPEDVVCDIRAERAGSGLRRRAGQAALLRWAAGSASGARAEFPAAPDALWGQVAWDAGCRCDVCPRRGYCRLTRGRQHARGAADLIVCSHDLFFADTFARDRLPPGRLPVLPPFSGVVFDEGHRVALAAQRAAGAQLRPAELLAAIEGAQAQGVRVRLAGAVDAARAAAGAFLQALEGAADAGEGRRRVEPGPELLGSARALHGRLGTLGDEMAIEEGLHEETEYAARLAIYQFRLDAAQSVLAALGDPDWLAWLEPDGGEAGPQGSALWAVPRELGPLWRRALPPRTPLVFSSATLAAGGSFAYAAGALGLPDALTARAGVPFRLARQVLCYVPGDLPPGDAPDFWDLAARRIARVLEATEGRALLLLPGPVEQRLLRDRLQSAFRLLWEGDAAPERLVADFAADVPACLVAHSLWEGIDVPGAALSAVIVPQLPLPGPDPVVEARREAARRQGQDAAAAVDVPDMALRLKQGVGRLIRSETDRGVIAILDGRAAGWPAVEAVLPDGARRAKTLAPVARFLRGGGAGAAGR